MLLKKDPQLTSLQKKKYLEIVYFLWEWGSEETHDEYPQLSVEELNKANEYYDSLRCEGCHCGSCVNLPSLARNLENSPEPLKPIAELAISLGKEEFSNNV